MTGILDMDVFSYTCQARAIFSLFVVRLRILLQVKGRALHVFSFSEMVV
uniref:Uncharacterized protein n=1 Tax=Arundo donax TaxID=35708 RepID=A0A0A8YVU5_ARUDO